MQVTNREIGSVSRLDMGQTIGRLMTILTVVHVDLRSWVKEIRSFVETEFGTNSFRPVSQTEIRSTKGANDQCQPQRCFTLPQRFGVTVGALEPFPRMVRAYLRKHVLVVVVAVTSRGICVQGQVK